MPTTAGFTSPALLDRSLYGPDLHRQRTLLDWNFSERHLHKVYASDWLIRNLDQAHCLKGHHGCVNALTWSENGRYLASGSDDTKILIWDAEAGMDGLRNVATIDTGHTANVFDVKFMPDSGNRKIVSVAGDAHVRAFDLEYGPRRIERKSTTIYDNNHDRTKRIATESNNLFLTCSEDGSVRQYDLRENPSEAAQRTPLVWHRKPRVALTALTINAAMPYLFATGGSGGYAFLHDRRMLRHVEMQWPGVPGLDQAKPSQLVRVMEPDEQHSDRHKELTALKFSQARPHELLASWMGEVAYTYDIRIDQDPAELQERREAYEREMRMFDSSSQSDHEPSPRPQQSDDDMPRRVEESDHREDEDDESEEDEDDSDEDEEADESEQDEGDDEEEEDDEHHDYSDEDSQEDDDDDDQRLEDLLGALPPGAEAHMNDLMRAYFTLITGVRPGSVSMAQRKPYAPPKTMPRLEPREFYQGHISTMTVKDIAYLGLDDEYVMSGSDDGNLFIYHHRTTTAVTILKGDGEVVNVMAPNPLWPRIAVSGIDNTIKIFEPCLQEADEDKVSTEVGGASDLNTEHCGWRCSAKTIHKSKITDWDSVIEMRD